MQSVAHQQTWPAAHCPFILILLLHNVAGMTVCACAMLLCVVHDNVLFVCQGEDAASISHRRDRSSGSADGQLGTRIGLEPISEGLFQVPMAYQLLRVLRRKLRMPDYHWGRQI